jgi:hypothetical protein
VKHPFTLSDVDGTSNDEIAQKKFAVFEFSGTQYKVTAVCFVSSIYATLTCDLNRATQLLLIKSTILTSVKNSHWTRFYWWVPGAQLLLGDHTLLEQL